MARSALVNPGISFPHLTPPACLGHPSSAEILGKLENLWMLKFDGNRFRNNQPEKKKIPLSSQIPWENKALVRKSLNFALDLERKFSIILDLGFVSKALGHLQRGVFSLWRRGAEIFGIFHGAGLGTVAFSGCSAALKTLGFVSSLEEQSTGKAAQGNGGIAVSGSVQ